MTMNLETYLFKLYITLSKISSEFGSHNHSTSAEELTSVLFSLHIAGGKTLPVIEHINRLVTGCSYLTLTLSSRNS